MGQYDNVPMGQCANVPIKCTIYNYEFTIYN